jgi:hypothetical protein
MCRFNKHVCCIRITTNIRGHSLYFIVGTFYNMPRIGRTFLITTTITTKNRRRHLKQAQDQLLLEQMKVAMVMKRMVEVILHQQNLANQMVRRKRNKGKVKILYLMVKLSTYT